jgi:hypothetical protein
LNEWQQTYGQQGLTIIGIHGYGDLSPGYIDEFGITYPIADDQDRDIWEAYGMQFHPSWALIDADGSLVQRQVGQVVTDDVIALIESELTTQ